MWPIFFAERGWMMIAVILVIVVGSIRLIGSNSNNVFSAVSSSLQ